MHRSCSYRLIQSYVAKGMSISFDPITARRRRGRWFSSHLALIPFPERIEVAADGEFVTEEQLAAKAQVKVKVQARAGTAPDSAAIAEPGTFILQEPKPERVIDLWREYRLSLAEDALVGLLVPECNWEVDYPEGRVPITHLALKKQLPWGARRQPGEQVVLDFGVVVVDRAEKRVPEASVCVAYVEPGDLQPQREAAIANPDPKAEPELRTSQEIQGNVLAGFNKDHQVFFFLKFPDGAGGRQWLQTVLERPEPEADGERAEPEADGEAPDPEVVVERPKPRGIATTKDVSEFNDRYREARRRKDPHLEDLKAVWVNVAFTYAGLGQLLPQLQEGLQQERFKAFREGPAAAARAADLGDDGNSAPNRWVVGGSYVPEVHALLSVAADDVDQLRDEVNRQLELAIKSNVDVVYEQRGDALPPPFSGADHFGFKDGVSQPGVRGYSRVRRVGNRDEDGDHPGSQIVAKDQFILGPEPLQWMAGGSFQVFRRLAQDVASWRVQLNYQSEGFPVAFQMRPALLAAKLVGRWPSGTPLARAPLRDPNPKPSPDDNAFDYANDDDGKQTPLFAHIRRMNARGGRPDRPRIIRRGIPFGAVYQPEAEGAEHHANAVRGLLFNAFMASIEDQFERLQKEFARSLDDAHGFGPDPLVGVPKDGGKCKMLRVSKEEKLDHPFELRRYVWTTGAVYAFAPSLTTLKALAEGKPEDLGL
jgi:Dyp-type peroxidase family